jgi:hypothetical protein
MFCSCYDCHMNMSCFLPKLHRDFLLHVLHLPLQRWTLDWHFFPQSWHCEFERYFHLYTFVRYERSESFWSALVKVSGHNKLILINLIILPRCLHPTQKKLTLWNMLIFNFYDKYNIYLSKIDIFSALHKFDTSWIEKNDQLLQIYSIKISNLINRH